MNKLDKRLILLELNEINFDIVQKYTDSHETRFPSLKKLLAGPHIRTSCEKQYEELEPWIQWASVHTGKEFKEHGIFRLGDIVTKSEFKIYPNPVHDGKLFIETSNISIQGF